MTQSSTTMQVRELNRIIDLRNVVHDDSKAKLERAESSRCTQQLLNPHAVAFLTCLDDEEPHRVCLRYIAALQLPSACTLDTIAVCAAPSMAERYQRV